MLFTPDVHGRLAQERIERDIARNALLRHVAPRPSTSFRQAVGHRFIRIGARLAAEPSLESVRSR